MKPSALLAKAKRVIQTKGWCQGQYHKPGDGYCAMGAIRFAKGGTRMSDEFLPDVRAAIDWFERALGTLLIDMWNDDPSRKKIDIIAAFNKAIKLAKKVGE